jgi:hypothetical protein
VTVNSFYGGNTGWFKAPGFMDGMWTKIRGGNGDWTVLTPDGRYLDRELKGGYAKWLQLPSAERQPNAYPVKKLTQRPKGAPPDASADSVIVRLAQRNLEKVPSGGWRHLTRATTKAWEAIRDPRWGPIWNSQYNTSFADVMWLSRAEWQALIPPAARAGETLPLPPGLKHRLYLWHLTNRTFCVGMPWEKRDIVTDTVSIRVLETDPVLRLRLEGSVLLEMKGTPEDTKKDWKRTVHGYDARLLGFIDCDRARKALTRFDVVAVGDYWGGDCEGGRHAKVGRVPLAIAFELGDPGRPRLEDRLLPCGGVYFDQYLKLK